MGEGDCIFCRIVSKEIGAKIIYEDEHVIAFEDINPQAPVHFLIISKKHIPTVLDISEEDKDLLMSMCKIAQKIAIEKNVAKKGFRLIMNCNPASGQTIYHLHMHFLGGRNMGWPPG